MSRDPCTRRRRTATRSQGDRAGSARRGVSRADRCAWKGCRCRVIELTYLKKPLCLRHWLRLCQMQDEGRDAEARHKLGLPPRPAKPPAPADPAAQAATSRHKDKS